MNNKKRILFLAAILALTLAYISSALPSVTFVSPTLSENATTNMNWTFVNITSTEDLNRSLLEWGNASGFTNVSMDNISGMTNWYMNMTDLVDGIYNYSIWAENTTGNWNRTAIKWLTIDTAAPYNLSACQDLTIENASYVLVQNVSSAGTCFNILANNITLDGTGYEIRYATASLGYAINYSGNNGSTIKSLKIIQDSNMSSHAIYGFGIINSTIRNNTIVANGLDSYGIYLISSNNSAISDNVISTMLSTSHAIYLNSSSNSNNISNNNITTSFTASLGIFFDTSSNFNSISENNITTFGNGSNGIQIYSSSNSNTIRNNNITTAGSAGIGIYLESSGNSSIANNTLNTSGSYGYGIFSDTSDNSSIMNNTIYTSGSGGSGVYLYASGNSSIIGNALRTENGTAIFMSGINASYFNHRIASNTEYGEPIYYYFGNSSIVIENVTNIGELIVANSTNITIRNMTLDNDGMLLGFVINSTIENSNITTVDDGIYLISSNLTTIANNTVTTSGESGYGIIDYLSGNSNSISNNRITTFSQIGYGVYLYGSGNSSIANNTINTAGSNGYGIYLYASGNSSIMNNTISTSGSNGYGIYLDWDGNSNTLLNNIIATSGLNAYGINIYSSYANNITGGSITSLQSYDYYLRYSDSTNKFTNTNFTAKRKAYFYYPTAYFNYNNDSGSIWLKTNVSAQDSLNRTLINWNNTLMQWNDTPSIGLTANYILTGLQATSTYKVYNASAGARQNAYSLNTDSGGILPAFTITMNEEMEIIVNYSGAYVAPPTCSDGIKNQDETGVDCGGSCSACSPGDAGDAGGGNTTKKTITKYPSNAITKLQVMLKTEMANPSISATKISSVPVEAPAGAVYQYINISKTNFADSDIETATIEFKVNKSWLASNNISKVYLLRYTGGWTKLITVFVDSSADYNNYIAYADGFSYFAIIGETADAAANTPALPINTTTSSGNANTNTNAAGSAGNAADTGGEKNRTPADTIISFIAAIMVLGGGIYVYDNYLAPGKKEKTAPAARPPALPEPSLPVQPEIAQKEDEEAWFENTARSSAKIMEMPQDYETENAETDYLIRRLKEARGQKE